MKYKILGALLCVLVLIISIFAPFFEGKKERYIQHIDSKTISKTDDSDFYSNLPLIEIDTNNEEIPGKAIDNDNGVYSLSKDGEPTINATMNIIENDNDYNHIDDSPALSSNIKIKLRGKSSRLFEKSSYKVDIINDGNDDCEVMGMSASNDWALYGPYMDKTLIRNYLWYNIAGEIMDYAPNIRFCEAFINGEYQGLYLMTETITGDKGRIDIAEHAKNNNFSGYVLRLDNAFDDEIEVMNNFSSYTKRAKSTFEIEYPKEKYLTDDVKKDIQLDFSKFEKALYSYDYDNDKYGYKKLININSFVYYFIINEFTCNYDAGGLSTYIYKAKDGKFNMCVWDFNNSCNNYENQINMTDFNLQETIWYYMLMKDEDFTKEIIKRYKNLRETYLNENYLIDFINDTIAYLGDAITRNNERWSVDSTNGFNIDESRQYTSYDEAVKQLEDFIIVRGRWLDENIETIKQYSAESKNKKFNEVTD